MVEQVRAGAAEQQEAASSRLAVGQHTQGGEEIRPSLYLVENDESGEVAQREMGIGEAGKVGGRFEIVPMHLSSERSCHRQGEGGLADLPSSENRHYRKLLQATHDLVDVPRSRDHAQIVL